jgi:hypothetical protein
MNFRRHGRLNLMTHIVGSVIAQEAQFVNAVAPARKQQASGFGEDTALICKALHA